MMARVQHSERAIEETVALMKDAEALKLNPNWKRPAVWESMIADLQRAMNYAEADRKEVAIAFVNDALFKARVLRGSEVGQ